MLATQSRRRVALSRAAGLATALRTLDLTSRLAWVPERPPIADRAPVPDIQFDIERYVPPARLIDGIEVRFGPTHTVFATARLARTPTRRDQQALDDALATIETTYPWHPSGVLAHVAYGRPYFDRLPPGLVALHMPRLLSNTNRFALEEAVGRACVEHNDVLFTLRGDDPLRLADTLAWLGGSDLLAGRRVASPRFAAGLAFTSSRAMFVQLGLPRKVAAAGRLPYHVLIHPRSPATTSTTLRSSTCPTTSSTCSSSTTSTTTATPATTPGTSTGYAMPTARRRRRSRCSSRPPTSSSGSATSWRCWTAWSGSSRRPGCRTSWCHRAGTAPSRSSSWPDHTGRGAAGMVRR